MKNKVILAVALSLVMGTGIGCSKQKPADTTTPPQQTPAVQENATPKADDNKVNADLTKKLTSEKGVLGGQIYKNKDGILGTMLLEKGTTPEVAKVLAQKYLEDIKVQYPGKKVNVQAVSDGKNVANVEYTP